jgi:hypothetical protein
MVGKTTGPDRGALVTNAEISKLLLDPCRLARQVNEFAS